MKLVAATCLLALAPTVTLANIIPTGALPTGLGPYTWAYDFQLSSDQNVNSGSSPDLDPVPHTNLGYGAFVTIYDFAGYMGGSCTGPAGWNCTAQNAGYTPDDVAPMDKLDIVNLTWTYVNGPTISGDPNGVNLGRFTAASIYDTVTEVSYAARGIKNNGASIGTIADNVGNTQGPTGNSVPEPSTMALAGLALAALGLRLRRGARQA